MEQVIKWLWPAAPHHPGDPGNRERLPQPTINIARLSAVGAALCFVAAVALDTTLLVGVGIVCGIVAVASVAIGLAILNTFD